MQQGERLGTKSSWDARKITALSILVALAFIVALVRIPVVLFLRYEAKDVIITMGGFIYGPLAVIAMSVVLSFLEMITVSDTGPIGMMMNIIATCSFACTASLIYRKWRTLTGALVALVAGIMVNVPVMLLWNYLITPIHLGHPRPVVAAMLLPVFLPFNLIKGALNAALIMLLYKPVRAALLKARLLPAQDSPVKATAKVNIGTVIASAFVLVTCVLVILSWRGLI